MFLTLFAVVIVWQQAEPFTFGAFESIPVLEPELWSFWLPYFLVLIVLEMLFAIAVYAWGWNWWLAATNLLLNVAFTVPALVFATGQLFNPEFLDVIGWPWGEAVERDDDRVRGGVRRRRVWDVIDGVIKTVRGRGGSARPRSHRARADAAGFAPADPPCRLLRLHADGAVEPDHLAVEHRVRDDRAHERGVLGRVAES